MYGRCVYLCVWRFITPSLTFFSEAVFWLWPKTVLDCITVSVNIHPFFKLEIMYCNFCLRRVHRREYKASQCVKMIIWAEFIVSDLSVFIENMSIKDNLSVLSLYFLSDGCQNWIFNAPLALPPSPPSVFFFFFAYLFGHNSTKNLSPFLLKVRECY